jgi:putative oxidoreductase
MLKIGFRLRDGIENAGQIVLPSVARLVFGGVLLMYFWSSAMTKLGDGALGFLFPSSGAYAQVFPKVFEAVGYDVSQLSVIHWVVVVAGMWAEFILPLLIILGLFTRAAAIGMIGFVIVQSVVDVTGHMADAATIGGWFDKVSSALILDQRALWIVLLLILVFKGPGPIALDRIFGSRPRA